MVEMNEVVSQMTIVVPADEVEELRQELLRNNMTPLQAETEGFDGASIVELIVQLTTIAIPALVGIYKARVAANRNLESLRFAKRTMNGLVVVLARPGLGIAPKTNADSQVLAPRAIICFSGHTDTS